MTVYAQGKSPYKNAASAIYSVCVAKSFPKFPNHFCVEAHNFLSRYFDKFGISLWLFIPCVYRCLVEDSQERASSFELTQDVFLSSNFVTPFATPYPSRVNLSRQSSLENDKSNITNRVDSDIQENVDCNYTANNYYKNSIIYSTALPEIQITPNIKINPNRPISSNYSDLKNRSNPYYKVENNDLSHRKVDRQLNFNEIKDSKYENEVQNIQEKLSTERQHDRNNVDIEPGDNGSINMTFFDNNQDFNTVNGPEDYFDARTSSSGISINNFLYSTRSLNNKLVNNKKSISYENNEFYTANNQMSNTELYDDDEIWMSNNGLGGSGALFVSNNNVIDISHENASDSSNNYSMNYENESNASNSNVSRVSDVFRTNPTKKYETENKKNDSIHSRNKNNLTIKNDDDLILPKLFLPTLSGVSSPDIVNINEKKFKFRNIMKKPVTSNVDNSVDSKNEISSMVRGNSTALEFVGRNSFERNDNPDRSDSNITKYTGSVDVTSNSDTSTVSTVSNLMTGRSSTSSLHRATSYPKNRGDKHAESMTVAVKDEVIKDLSESRFQSKDQHLKNNNTSNYPDKFVNQRPSTSIVTMTLSTNTGIYYLIS